MGVDEAVAAPVAGRGPDWNRAFIQIMCAVSLLTVLQLNLLTAVDQSTKSKAGRRGRTKMRKRASIDDFFNVLGPIYFRRSYRMPKEKFDEMQEEKMRNRRVKKETG